MVIIEVDGVNSQPLEVDSIQIFAGQRYSFIVSCLVTPTCSLTYPYVPVPIVECQPARGQLLDPCQSQRRDPRLRWWYQLSYPPIQRCGCRRAYYLADRSEETAERVRAPSSRTHTSRK